LDFFNTSLITQSSYKEYFYYENENSLDNFYSDNDIRISF